MENRGPSEQGGPSGEGTSRNVMFVPPATAGRDGAGELPTAPPPGLPRLWVGDVAVQHLLFHPGGCPFGHVPNRGPQ